MVVFAGSRLPTMSQPTATPPHDSWRFMWGFIFLTSFAGIGIGIARVATSLYAVDLHANELQMGVISAAQSIGILFMALPVGILIQQWGATRLFVLGSTMGGVMYAVLPIYPQIWYLIVCTALISFCMPLRFVSLNSVFLQHLRELGEAKAGWFRGTHMLGFFLLGPVLAVWLHAHVGFVGTFWAVALTFWIAAWLAPVVLKSHGVRPVTDTLTPRLDWDEIKQRIILLFSHPQLRYASQIELFTQAVMAYYSFFVVVIAIKNFGFSAAQAAALVTLQGSIFVLALFTMGVMVSRYGYKRFYRISFILVISALMLIGLTKNAWLLIIGSIALGFGQGMLQVINFTVYAKVGEHIGVGKISGVTVLAGPAGGLIGSIVGGWLGYLVGLQQLFLLFSAIFIGLLWQLKSSPNLCVKPPVSTFSTLETES